DDLDGVERREAWGDELLEEQTQEVAVEGADLLADHDVDAELGAGERPFPGAEAPADLVVNRDGHDVETPLDGGHGLLGALRTCGSARPWALVLIGTSLAGMCEQATTLRMKFR